MSTPYSNEGGTYTVYPGHHSKSTRTHNYVSSPSVNHISRYNFQSGWDSFVILTAGFAAIQLAWIIYSDIVGGDIRWWTVGMPSYVFICISFFIVIGFTLDELRFCCSKNAKATVKIPPVYRMPSFFVLVLIHWAFEALVVTVVLVFYDLSDDSHKSFPLWAYLLPSCTFFTGWWLLDTFSLIFGRKNLQPIFSSPVASHNI